MFCLAPGLVFDFFDEYKNLRHSNYFNQNRKLIIKTKKIHLLKGKKYFRDILTKVQKKFEEHQFIYYNTISKNKRNEFNEDYLFVIETFST
ncbi:hypothetical protein BpHYR1_041456 [Brachionus plicatilis]|uniref:Uncharacterized protein n=1 Tax=Brachionus plicatilis TaxID=10195 RepID=A0A3M7SWM6_BRAPC|nr:hypothetical protein BpHYR1_041456 [Brachionus plicatilis]